MLREDLVFGPIRSRRLGTSLGINILPTDGKVCNFDCIYCECGWNADGRTHSAMPTAAQLRSRLEDKLAELLLDGTTLDSITFSGTGEPTLNPEFPRIIDDTLKLRDAYCPGVKVSVLSNATRITDPEIREALRKVDNPILKLDAPREWLAAKINRPYPGYDIRLIVDAMKLFDGDFILQTMFLRSPDFDSSDEENLTDWMDIVRSVHPRQIMVYTIDRPTPASNLEKFSPELMRALLTPLFDEGFNIQISG